MQGLTAAERKLLRSMIIDLVLATCPAKHFELSNTVAAKIIADENVWNPGDGNGINCDTLSSQQIRVVLQLLLVIADLGHTTKPIDAHLQWVTRLQMEFFFQGDEEKRLGMPVSPLMDRTKPGPCCGHNQEGFFKFVVEPQLKRWVSLFPNQQPLLDQLHENIAFWKQNPGPVEVDITTTFNAKDLELMQRWQQLSTGPGSMGSSQRGNSLDARREALSSGRRPDPMASSDLGDADSRGTSGKDGSATLTEELSGLAPALETSL